MDSEPSEELNFWEWLLNPNAFPIIHDHLRQYLNVAELLSLSLTSKKLEPIRHYTLKKAANIDALLKDYVQNAQLFRSYLRDANALISGSFALNVFEMGRLKVRKMDIFVEDGPMADHFMLLLDVWEQYESQTEQDDEQDDEVKPQSPKRLEYPCSVLANSFTASPYFQVYQQGAKRLRASRHSNSRATCSTYHDFITHNSLCQLRLGEQGVFHLSPTHLHTASACSTKIPRR